MKRLVKNWTALVSGCLFFGLVGCADKKEVEGYITAEAVGPITIYLPGDKEYFIEFGNRKYKAVPGMGLQEAN